MRVSYKSQTQRNEKKNTQTSTWAANAWKEITELDNSLFPSSREASRLES